MKWYSKVETLCLKYDISFKTVYNIINSSWIVKKKKDWREAYYEDISFFEAIKASKTEFKINKNYKVKWVKIESNTVVQEAPLIDNFNESNIVNEPIETNYNNNNKWYNNNYNSTKNPNIEDKSQLAFIRDTFKKDLDEMKTTYQTQIDGYKDNLNTSQNTITELKLSVTTRDNDIRLKTESLKYALDEKRDAQKKYDITNDELTTTKISQAKLKLINKIYITIIIVIFIFVPLTLFIVNYLNIKF